MKYGAMPVMGFILFIIGCSVASGDDDDGDGGSAAGGSILIVLGIGCIIGFIAYLFRGYCLTGGARKTTTSGRWSSSAVFSGSAEDVLNTVEEQERLNVKVDLHPSRDAFLDEDFDDVNAPLAGRELTASATRSCHMLQMTYREKRSGKIVDCKAVVDPTVTLEQLAQTLSFLSNLAENADKTKGLGATLHQPTASWDNLRRNATRGSDASSHIGSDITTKKPFGWSRRGGLNSSRHSVYFGARFTQSALDVFQLCFCCVKFVTCIKFCVDCDYCDCTPKYDGGV